MAGLFDTLSLGSRSLNTYRKAIDTAGHNLANVNTPGYTRQRVVLESVSANSDIGQVGAGSEATQVVRLQNEFFDKQIGVEASVEGSLQARQDTLQQALSSLQETIDRSDASGTTTSGISQGLADFFASLQSVSADSGSIAERQVLLGKAQTLATRFNQVDARLNGISGDVDKKVTAETGQVNTLAADIARLNAAIVREEALADGSANDLRDSRQTKIEELSHLIKVDTAEQPTGAVNIVAGGLTLVDGVEQANTLESFISDAGTLQVRAAGQTTPLVLTSGSIQGSIETRDTDIGSVREQIATLAQNLINEVNKLHSPGFSLTGSTGADFFTGTKAGDIQVNAALAGNPALVQLSSVAGESGENQVALALARLASTAQPALNGQTFSDRQAQIVAGLGQKVATAQNDLEDQQAISGYVKSQRESLSGVSLDEEMSNLVMFQKAFQASAKLISMTDELLATIIQM